MEVDKFRTWTDPAAHPSLSNGPGQIANDPRNTNRLSLNSSDRELL